MRVNNYVQFTIIYNTSYVIVLLHKYCTRFSKYTWRKRPFVEIYFGGNGHDLKRGTGFLAEKGYAYFISIPML